MTPFLLYQLKAGLCIMLFTGLYYALFRKETFYRFNRFYLVGSLVLSFIIPAIQFPPVTVSGNLPAFITFIGEVTVYANAQVHAANVPAEKTIPLLWQVYRLVSLFMVAVLIYQLITLALFIMRGETHSRGAYRIVALPENKNSFSFFNLIFLNAHALHEGDESPVLQHELSHAHQWHSLDIMAIQLVKTMQWFNPFIYLMENALKETHEYLADEAVLEQHGGFDRYRLLLLTQVFGIQPGIFSFFNYSRIKKRLIMMTKKKSPLHNRLKYLTVLPLVAILTLALCSRCSQSKEPAPSSTVVNPEPEITDVTAAGQDTLAAENDTAWVFVEKVAQFQGGSLETFRDWVQQNLVYPPEAVEKGIFGRVTVQFTVNTQGRVGEVKIIRGVDPKLDKEVIRVILLSPEWIPAEDGGRKVKQQFVMPVIFQLK